MGLGRERPLVKGPHRGTLQDGRTETGNEFGAGVDLRVKKVRRDNLVNPVETPIHWGHKH